MRCLHYDWINKYDIEIAYDYEIDLHIHMYASMIWNVFEYKKKLVTFNMCDQHAHEHTRMHNNMKTPYVGSLFE